MKDPVSLLSNLFVLYNSIDLILYTIKPKTLTGTTSFFAYIQFTSKTRCFPWKFGRETHFFLYYKILSVISNASKVSATNTHKTGVRPRIED